MDYNTPPPPIQYGFPNCRYRPIDRRDLIAQALAEGRSIQVPTERHAVSLFHALDTMPERHQYELAWHRGKDGTCTAFFVAKQVELQN